MSDAPGITTLLFVGVPMAIFILFIVPRMMRAARRYERRVQIETEMRQQYNDANDTQRIAQKLLREYDR